MKQTAIGLIFHGIGLPQRDLEPGEAPYWISTDRFERILDQLQGTFRPDLIRLSFDDGNASDHDIALPRLLARGLKADFFVLVGRIGQEGSLSADQVRALRAAGMAIGSHGIAHLDWRQLDGPALEAELAESRAALGALLAYPVTAAGIPFGAYNARVLRALRRAGYAVAYSSDRGRMQLDAFLRPRTSVWAQMNDLELTAVLANRISLGKRIRRTIGMARRQWS